MQKMVLGGGGALFFLALLLLLPIWFWFFCRIEPAEGQFAVLIRKTGSDLPSGQIMATEPGQKGIQLEVLSEGRYFRNPYTWSWRIFPITDIPAGQLGVLTRLYGSELPPGEVIASGESKGITRDVLGPGRHRINPFAYQIQILDATSIRPGHIGVMVALDGADPLVGGVPDDSLNRYTVGDGVKGVQPATLDPGTHYLNPFVTSVVELNLQSQRFEMSGDDMISFLTADGFTVNVEGTLEFAINRDKAAMLTHQVGDMEDIIKKVILPRARGFSRIEGSKSPALNYIVGEMRQKFQDNLEKHLSTQCAEWGVSIKSVLVRNISAPDQIASIIREREVAVQNARMFDQQITQARSRAELVRQEMLAVQNKEKVQAETVRLQAVILAKQDQQVKLTGAQQQFTVAGVESQAAESQAAAIVALAEGDRDALHATNEAEAGVLRSQAQAFGGGANFARNLLYKKIAPRISSILTNDEADSIGALFKSFLPQNTREGAR